MTTPTVQLASVTSRSRVTLLYPGVRPLVYRVLEDVYVTTRRRMNVIEGLRSFDYQMALYAKGRKFVPENAVPFPADVAPPEGMAGKWVVVDQRRIVTNAKPGLSWHCYGLAFDCAWAGRDPWLEEECEASRKQLWAAFAAAVRGNGLECGADFRGLNGLEDLDHAQLRYGLQVAEVFELHETKGLMGVWAHCDRIRGVPLGQDWGPGL